MPSPSAAFNLAVCQKHLQRPRQGLLVLQDLLAGRFGKLDSRQDAEARALAEGLRERLAILVVEVTPANVAATSVVDEDPSSSLTGSRSRWELDPGTHRVVITAPGHARAELSVALAPGALRIEPVSLTPVPPALAASPIRLEADAPAPARPWLWGSVALGVLGLAALTFFLLQGDDATTEPGPIPEIRTLRVSF